MGSLSDYNKEELIKELQLKNRVLVEGLSFPVDIFSHLDVGGEIQETVHVLFTADKHAHKDVEFPACFLTPKGKFRVGIRWNQDSLLSIRYIDGQYHVFDRNTPIFENLHFVRRSPYYKLHASDGTAFRTIATDNGHGALFVSYSNECSLKDKGLDCLFCNINTTKSIYGEAQGISWKTPKQVGEAISAGYRGYGFDHVTISGGFVPERREVEYYLDVAEAIQNATGLEDFNGTACVGAPRDLTVLEKYKDAGYRTFATNMEVWSEKMFDLICPGKAQECGGRSNWLAALKYEVELFGRYRVRSTLVSGIEPKESLMTGIEYLVEHGVIAQPSQWYVNVGSALQGHRTPDPDWHWEVFERTVALYRKHGVTWDQLRDANAGTDAVPFDLYRILEGIDVKGFYTNYPELHEAV